jgi:probable HAF family extracellular repeat protein
MRGRNSFLLAASLLLAPGASAQAAALYDLTNLGRGTANGINAAGVVVGGLGASDAMRAFQLEAGSISYLADSHSVAEGINDSGDIWGTTGRLLQTSGFIKVAGGEALLDTGSFFIQDVERYSSRVDAPAGLYTDMRLGALDGRAAYDVLGCCVSFSTGSGAAANGRARALNQAWTVTGQYDGQAFVAAFGTGPGSDYGPVQLLGTLGGATSTGTDINDQGVIVGHSKTMGGFDRAFVYANGVMTNLGALDGVDLATPSSYAYAINNSGLIVGSSQVYAEDELFPSTRATLWRDGAVFDLNSFIDPALGFVLASAFAVNDSGHIVGEGYLRGDQQQRRYAFVLTPISSGAVPEPANWALMISGFGLIGSVARRQRRVLLAW